MGNSCTREDQVVLSESGRPVARHATAERGRWSAPNAGESVDLDTLLEAPSPPPSARQRHQRKKERARNARKHSGAHDSGGANGLPPRPPNHRRARAGSTKRGRAQTEARRKGTAMLEEEAPVYHSYEDPGYMGGDIELTHFDSDCILGSPPDSPTVIHARWGEPVDDPDEESVCTEYHPNPFKLGFCVNCQKQHDVTDSGDVVGKKEYKKIARPTVAWSAASALDNPAALANAPASSSSSAVDNSPALPPGGRESDVDLAALLQQRREVLLKLTRLEQEKARIKRGTAANRAPVSAKRTAFDPSASRHTMLLPDSSSTSLAHLRRVGSRPPASGPIVHRGTSVVLSPRPTSMRGISKSVSWGSHLRDADDEPAQNDWF